MCCKCFRFNPKGFGSCADSFSRAACSLRTPCEPPAVIVLRNHMLTRILAADARSSVASPHQAHRTTEVTTTIQAQPRDIAASYIKQESQHSVQLPGVRSSRVCSSRLKTSNGSVSKRSKKSTRRR